MNLATLSPGVVMKLIGATCMLVGLFAADLAAQKIKTVTTEKTTFEVTDGDDVTVSGCVARFTDGGYMLTDDAGELRYVLVTNRNLSKYVGQRIEVSGLSTEGGHGRIEIDKVVGTSGEIGGQKIDDVTTVRTSELKGDIGFPYLGVKSLKKISSGCR